MRMPNSPHPETVTVSFTLPRELAVAVNRRAKQGLTNKSAVIRQALMAYLSPAERAAVLKDESTDYRSKKKKP